MFHYQPVDSMVDHIFVWFALCYGVQVVDRYLEYSRWVLSHFGLSNKVQDNLVKWMLELVLEARCQI